MFSTSIKFCSSFLLILSWAPSARYSWIHKYSHIKWCCSSQVWSYQVFIPLPRLPSRWRLCCWHLLSAGILDSYWIVILPTVWECLPSAQPHLTALDWILLSVHSHLNLPRAFFCPPSQNGSSKCKDIDIGSTYANRWGTQSPPSAPPCHSSLPGHCPAEGTAVWTPPRSGLCK